MSPVFTKEVSFIPPEKSEIDAVRFSLESSGSEFGDALSDKYRVLLDTATDPRQLPKLLEEERRRNAVRMIADLEANRDFIEVCMTYGAERYDTPGLQEFFDSSVAQAMRLVGIDTPS